MERLIKVGKVEPKHSRDVKSSRLGLGFEKLDRDVFDPEKAYDRVGELGVKWIRLQSGWAKTEKEKGVYDFAWLDKIVDNLIERGLVPWMCLCYGNGLYTPDANKYVGCIGCPPINTEEEKQGWANYCKAIAKHFKGRIEYYEVWNEPDGAHCWKHGPDGTEYGIFAIDTAKALKEADPDCKVIGGSICCRELQFLDKALAAGMGNYIDAITFHEYTHDESWVLGKTAAFRGALKSHGCGHIEIIQGESGSQSKSGGSGALKKGAWTQHKQAKQLIRHAIIDFLADVKFSEYFSCMDMIEALKGVVGDAASYGKDFAYFGVLAADFDENGFSTGDYTPKPSYYALQNLASLFACEFVVEEQPVYQYTLESTRMFGFDCDDKSIIHGGFTMEDGRRIYAYWNSTNLMTTDFESTISWEVANIGMPKLVDPMDGSIYEIPDFMIDKFSDKCFLLKNLPIKDYPLLLVFDAQN